MGKNKKVLKIIHFSFKYVEKTVENSFLKHNIFILYAVLIFVILFAQTSTLIFAQSTLPSLNKFSKYNEKKKEEIILETVEKSPENYDIYKYILLVENPQKYFIKLKNILEDKIKKKDLEKKKLVRYYKNLTFTYFFLNESENFIYYFEMISKYLSSDNFNLLNSIYLIFSSIEGTSNYNKGIKEFVPYISKIKGLTEYILKYLNNSEFLYIVVDKYEKNLYDIYSKDKKKFESLKKEDIFIFENLLFTVKRADTLSDLISILSRFKSKKLKQVLNNYLYSQFSDVKLASIKALFSYYKISEINFNIFYDYLENGDLQFRNDIYKILSKYNSEKIAEIYGVFYNKESIFIKEDIINYLFMQESVKTVNIFIKILKSEKEQKLIEKINITLIKYLNQHYEEKYLLTFIKNIFNNNIYNKKFFEFVKKILFYDSRDVKEFTMDYIFKFYDPSVNEYLFKFIFLEKELGTIIKAFAILKEKKQNEVCREVFKRIAKDINNSKDKKLIVFELNILKRIIALKNYAPDSSILESILSIKEFIKNYKDFDKNILSKFILRNRTDKDLNYIKNALLLAKYFKFYDILNNYLKYNDKVVILVLNVIKNDLQQLYIKNLVNLLYRDKKISFLVVDILLKYKKDLYFDKIFDSKAYLSENYLVAINYLSKKIDISTYLESFGFILEKKFNTFLYDNVKDIYTTYITKDTFKNKKSLIKFIENYKKYGLPVLYNFINQLNKKNDIKILTSVIESIGNIGYSGSIPILKNLLNHKSISIQIKTIEALSRISVPEVVDVLINWGKNNISNVSAQIYIFKTFEIIWNDKCFNYLQIFVNGNNKILKEKALFLLSLHPVQNTLQYFLQNLEKDNISDLFFQFYNNANINLKIYILQQLKNTNNNFFIILLNGIVQGKINFNDKNLILFLKPYINRNKNILSDLFFNLSDKKIMIPLLSIASDDDLFGYAYESVETDLSLSQYFVWGFLNDDLRKIKLSASIVLNNLYKISLNEVKWYLDYLYKHKNYKKLNNIMISHSNAYKIFSKSLIFELLKIDDYKLAFNSLILLNNFKLNLKDLETIISINPNYLFLFKRNINLTKYEKFILFKKLIKYYKQFDSNKKVFILDNYLNYFDKDILDNLIFLYIQEKDKIVYKYLENIILKAINLYPNEIERFLNIYFNKNKVNKNNINSLSINFLLKINNIYAAKLLLKKNIKKIPSHKIVSFINNNQISNSLLYYLYKVYPDSFFWLLEGGNLTNYRISPDFLIELLQFFTEKSKFIQNTDYSLKLLINTFDLKENEQLIAKKIIKLENNTILSVYLNYLIDLINTKYLKTEINLSSKNKNYNPDFKKSVFLKKMQYNNRLLLLIGELYLNIKDPFLQLQILNKINENKVMLKYFVKNVLYFAKLYNKKEEVINSVYILFRLDKLKFDETEIDRSFVYNIITEYFLDLFKRQNLWNNNFTCKYFYKNKKKLNYLKKIIDPIFDNIDFYSYLNYVETNLNNKNCYINGIFTYNIKNNKFFSLFLKTLFLIKPELLKYNMKIEQIGSYFLEPSNFSKAQIDYFIDVKNIYILKYLVVSGKYSFDFILSLIPEFNNRINFINFLAENIIYIKGSFKLLDSYYKIFKKYDRYFYISFIKNFDNFSVKDKIKSTYIILNNYSKLNFYYLSDKKQFDKFIIFILKNLEFYEPRIITDFIKNTIFPFYKYYNIIFNDRLQKEYKIYYEKNRENFISNYYITSRPINQVRLYYLNYFLEKYKNPEIIGKYLIPYVKNYDWLSEKMFDKVMKDKIKGLDKYFLKYFSGKKWDKYLKQYKNIE